MNGGPNTPTAADYAASIVFRALEARVERLEKLINKLLDGLRAINAK